MAVKRVPYLLGHTEIARLLNVGEQTPALWRKRGILAEPDAEISGKPYWLLDTVLALAVPGQRDISHSRLAEYKAGIPGGYSAPGLTGPPPLIGLKEVAWLFGKREADVAQWRKRGTLADPDLMLSGSPLWHIDTIVEDSGHRGRNLKPGVLDRIQAGERALVQPRGRRGSNLPGPRTFASNESLAALAFVEDVMNAGYGVVVRPRHDPQETHPESEGRAHPK